MMTRAQQHQSNPVSGGFSAQQCDALFAAVLVHDNLHPGTRLPAAMKLDYSQEQLGQCYGICRQIWKQGVERKTLRALIAKIGAHSALDDNEQRAFKHIRARFKHLRFAFVVCDKSHRYPFAFHLLTAMMGKMQDAFKNDQRASTRFWASTLNLALAPWPYGLIVNKISQFKPATSQSFQGYVGKQIGRIGAALGKGPVTSKEFHEMRKVISRLVALYDNLKTLWPGPDLESISRYLSTLNGMMGAMHDDLVAKKFSKAQDYYADKFTLPQDIRTRLRALVERFEGAFAGGQGGLIRTR